MGEVVGFQNASGKRRDQRASYVSMHADNKIGDPHTSPLSPSGRQTPDLRDHEYSRETAT
jgi:hypothetical protein